MVGIGVRPERYSRGLIESNGEFTVNMPTAAMAEKILKAFAKDSKWRFKYDEPFEKRSPKGGRERSKGDAAPEKPARKKKVKTHKPLREEFFKWISESE